MVNKKIIVGINGSPRRGNSYKLLSSFLEGAKDKGFEIRLIDACKIKISPCQECGYCSKEGICRIDDEMTEVRNLLASCAHIAIGSPVFFFGVSAQLKTLIDRCQPFWAMKYLLKKDLSKKFNFERKGFFFSAGGFNKPITFKGGELTIKAFFDCLSVKYEANIFAESMEYRDDILKRKDLLARAYELGNNLNPIS